MNKLSLLIELYNYDIDQYTIELNNMLNDKKNISETYQEIDNQINKIINKKMALAYIIENINIEKNDDL